MTLISVSPMAIVCDRVGIDNFVETTVFDAVTHIRQLEDVFQYFGIDIPSWVSCVFGDNDSVNNRVSRLLEVPLAGCSNNKLSLEVTRMMEKDRIRSTLVESVHDTMSTCMRKLKDQAILRNLTSLALVLNKVTRLSYKY